MAFIGAPEREQIRRAIGRAESATSGELVTVLARISDAYRYIPILWAAAVALLVPAAFLLLPFVVEFAREFGGGLRGWGYDVPPAMLGIYVVQLSSFIVLAIAFQWLPLKIRLVPRRVRNERARRLAHEQFYIHRLQMTGAHTGVLLFVSVAERYVEIIADHGIGERVAQDAWESIVAELVVQLKAGRTAEGLVAAIEACGALLAQHFPRSADDDNELPDHLVELD